MPLLEVLVHPDLCLPAASFERMREPFMTVAIREARAPGRRAPTSWLGLIDAR